MAVRVLVGRRGRQLSACAVLVSGAIVGSACSNVADTTQLSADEFPDNTAVPTTVMQTGELPTTTTTTTVATLQRAAATNPTDLTGTLGVLVSQFAANPALVTQLSTLDLGGLAGLLGIDLASLQQLGLSIPDFQQLGLTVLGSSPELQASLAGGPIDTATLVGLLSGSVDLNAIAGGAVATLVQALIGSITGLKVVVSPQLTVELSDLLQELDPNGLGPVAANPANASLLALLTSAIISANPLFAQQLLSSPLLDPALASLLAQLQDLSASLGDAATVALLQALNQFFPGLLQNLGIPSPG